MGNGRCFDISCGLRLGGMRQSGSSPGTKRRAGGVFKKDEKEG